MIITSKGGGRPGMMPVGTFRAKISRIVPREGANLMLIFTGLDGEATNTECADFVNVESAEWRIRLIYEAALGTKYPAEGLQWDTADLQDREVMVECEHRLNPKTDELQARATKIYPAN